MQLYDVPRYAETKKTAKAFLLSVSDDSAGPDESYELIEEDILISADGTRIYWRNQWRKIAHVYWAGAYEGFVTLQLQEYRFGYERLFTDFGLNTAEVKEMARKMRRRT